MFLYPLLKLHVISDKHAEAHADGVAPATRPARPVQSLCILQIEYYSAFLARHNVDSQAHGREPKTVKNIVRGEHETHWPIVWDMQDVRDLHPLLRVIEFPPPLVCDHIDFCRRVISAGDESRRQPQRTRQDD